MNTVNLVCLNIEIHKLPRTVRRPDFIIDTESTPPAPLEFTLHSYRPESVSCRRLIMSLNILESPLGTTLTANLCHPSIIVFSLSSISISSSIDMILLVSV